MDRNELTNILSEWILLPFTIIESGEMAMMAAPDGMPVTARDAYLQKYRRRLESLRRLDFVQPELIEKHEKVVQILESIDPSEALTYWEAQTELWLYAGVCCRLGMISFYGPLPPDSDNSRSGSPHSPI